MASCALDILRSGYIMFMIGILTAVSVVVPASVIPNRHNKKVNKKRYNAAVVLISLSE